MEKEFITYEQALALKELDYDEPCLAKFVVPYDLVLPGHYENTDVVCATITQNDICEAHLLAPTKSQVFRWFRKTYEYRFHCPINVGIPHGEEKIHYFFNIIKCGKHHKNIFRSKFYKTPEEAESACIDKLIELAKQ